jgi:alpha-2-macroglobulin
MSKLLQAGKPVDLIVDITVQKQSPVEHVMIEVPIPGSCSYADKRQEYRGVKTYREYFKEKTLICCESLTPGKYSFTIHLLPRFTGKYYVNPAQVALMYFPVVNANTDMKQVKVCP